MNDKYISPKPITDNYGLVVDHWFCATIAQGILDRGNIFLCQTIPEFREVWDGMTDRAITMEGYLRHRYSPDWVKHSVNVIRAGLVLFGDSTITDEEIDMETRVFALHQSIRDVIVALNRGELTEAIIQEAIDKRERL